MTCPGASPCSRTRALAVCSKFAPAQPSLLHVSVLYRDAGHSEGHDPSWVEMNPEGTLPRGITALHFQAVWLNLSL